jgi:hypothetical protein
VEGGDCIHFLCVHDKVRTKSHWDGLRKVSRRAEPTIQQQHTSTESDSKSIHFECAHNLAKCDMADHL